MSLAWESVPPKRGTDCRVASLLAMTARRCRADGTSGRRPLRVVQRTCPVGRDPCVPPFCSCHSEFVGADDSVRPHALAWESVHPKRGTDCRVASLLAMTARRCRADGTSGRRPLRVVQRTCPVGRDPCVPPFCSCHSEFVGADDSVRPHALAWESVHPKRGTDCRVASLLAMTDFFDSLRGGALPRLCCFAGTNSRKCNSCRNTLHETV